MTSYAEGKGGGGLGERGRRRRRREREVEGDREGGRSGVRGKRKIE